MKELTIEEKAKAYDEAIEKFDVILNLNNVKKSGTIFADDVRKIFPELKESEDERIRKALKEYFINSFQNNGVAAILGVHIKDILAWLEKQGKQKSLDDISKEVTKDKNAVISFLKSAGIMNEKGELADEYKIEQGEQKPADKVEPKFHEGEWMCENEPNNYARFIQILEIVNVQGKDRYRISRDIHKDEDVVEFDFVEKYYHKFDIKDAKDGDVLADGNLPFIFKKIDFMMYSYAYCGISVYSDFKIESEGKFGEWTWAQDIKPATKEQRNLLFQKMKEAGYEWDAEKKELKKIKLRQEELTEFEKSVKQVMEEAIECGDTHNLKADADMLLRLAQKPAWSEEDEKNLLEISCLIGNYRTGEDEYKLDSWLKSLKERVHPQPKSDWGEEDEKMLQNILECLKKGWRKLPTDILKYESWLKSLRPQNT